MYIISYTHFKSVHAVHVIDIQPTVQQEAFYAAVGLGSIAILVPGILYRKISQYYY